VLKRKGQASGSTDRLTRGQLDSYNAVSAAIGPAFNELRQVRHQIERFSRATSQQASRSRGTIANIVAEGIEWEPQTELLKLPKTTVVLCRQSAGNDFAIVQQFPAESAYAKANGQNKILLRSLDPRQLS
jgi:hypothetical protein